jgi:hypothetical protein
MTAIPIFPDLSGASQGSGDHVPWGQADAFRLNTEARRAIDGARGHLVGPGHLRLGILRNPGGRAGRVLGAGGVTRSSAMGAIVAVGGRQSTDRGWRRWSM